MKQLLQHLRSGEIELADVPSPACPQGGVLVQTSASVVSVGTERAMAEFGASSVFGKARARPDLVRKVLDAVRREGLATTLQKVRSQLDTYRPLGYSCAGIVRQSSSESFRVGDRVACGGVGFANHAELCAVPTNLTVHVTATLELWEAAFATIGAIALQGVRQADVRIGERVGVIGLGLLGQLSCQILRAAGCKVTAIDIAADAVDLARRCGADHALIADGDTVAQVAAATNGFGLDAIVIAASGTSNAPLELAAQLARDRARIVAVGAVGLSVPREVFFRKDLTLWLSRSYGPGRYDRTYEENGVDYPIGYVRWTENRNMSAFLELVATRHVSLEPLITHRLPFGEGAALYHRLVRPSAERFVGVVLDYPQDAIGRVLPTPARPWRPAVGGTPQIGFIGAGKFAQAMLLPHLRGGGVLATVVTSTPASAVAVARRFGFGRQSCESRDVIDDPAIDLVFVATPHDTHAMLVTELLRAGKRVFVEKPLALSEQELMAIEAAYTDSSSPWLMVGYNRRFSPAIVRIRTMLEKRAGPASVLYRVNAGPLSKDGWYGDPRQGGRIIGEVCHFVDTMVALCGTEASTVSGTGPMAPAGGVLDDVAATIRFTDGSTGTLVYTSQGHGRFGKEYLEVHADGHTAVLNDYRSLTIYRGGKTERFSVKGKGHREEIDAVISSASSGAGAPIDFGSLAVTSRTTFAIIHSALQGGGVVPIGTGGSDSRDKA